MNTIIAFIMLLAVGFSERCLAYETDNDVSPTTENESETNGRYIIQIDNMTEEDCYFWINPTPVGETTSQALVRQYFWTIPNGGVFAFGHLITDPNIVFGDCGIVLGYNFIKVLSPGKSFQVILLSDGNEAEYVERFVIIPEREIERYFGKIPDYFLYKNDHIIVTVD